MATFWRRVGDGDGEGVVGYGVGDADHHLPFVHFGDVEDVS